MHFTFFFLQIIATSERLHIPASHSFTTNFHIARVSPYFLPPPFIGSFIFHIWLNEGKVKRLLVSFFLSKVSQGFDGSRGLRLGVMYSISVKKSPFLNT